ncbi:hypothetical protein D9613_004404 [Agrocybe pediades]|uniref:Uncharacterized protein n=1 Tax=Agrocybe pediades TaxID=84607 RepID=A0A8H4QIU5_9AGAR|nr:hypothetical protein D9613_004404 [Agrocybe pediades]
MNMSYLLAMVIPAVLLVRPAVSKTAICCFSAPAGECDASAEMASLLADPELTFFGLDGNPVTPPNTCCCSADNDLACRSRCDNFRVATSGKSV